MKVEAAAVACRRRMGLGAKTAAAMESTDVPPSVNSRVVNGRREKLRAVVAKLAEAVARCGAEQGTPRRGRAVVELRWSLGRSCVGRSGWRRKGSFYSAGRSEAARRGQRAQATWLGGAEEQLARGGLAATPLAGRASSRGQGFSTHWVGKIVGV